MKSICRFRLSILVAVFLVPSIARPQGDPLGPEFQVNTFTTGGQDRSSVAAASGNFAIVWTTLAQDGSNYDVLGQRYSGAGVPLGAEFRVNTVTTGNQLYPSVAASASGFVVVWENQSGVTGQRYSTTGAPLGPEFPVNSDPCCSAFLPSVAADPGQGDFVVVWFVNYGGIAWGIRGQRYAVSGAPLGAEFPISGANEILAQNDLAASVAVDGAGNFVVVWHESSSGDVNVFGQRYASSGAPLGGEFRVNTYTVATQAYPSVAADSSGNFVVVWSGPDYGSVHSMFGQRFAAAGMPLGPEFRVSTYSNIQVHPAVASDGSGNFVVTWDDQDGSDRGILGQRYGDTGEPQGAPFRVNTFTTGRQDQPAVAAAVDVGDFVVVWTSEGQDGSSDGVFGQRFGRIVPVALMRFRVE